MAPEENAIEMSGDIEGKLQVNSHQTGTMAGLTQNRFRTVGLSDISPQASAIRVLGVNVRGS